MSDFFITGTDTDSGKTYVTCALLRDLRRRGMKAAGFKPVACGDRGDARAMREAMGEPTLGLDLLNPVYLRAATAPAVAAELESRELSVHEWVEGYKRVSGLYESVLVEGAGGWETPLATGKTIADLAQQLALPVILVVGNRLGAVNHAILTVQAIRLRGLECRSIVLNHMAEEWDAASVMNRKLIEEYAGVPVQAELIRDQQEIDSCAVLGI